MTKSYPFTERDKMDNTLLNLLPEDLRRELGRTEHHRKMKKVQEEFFDISQDLFAFTYGQDEKHLRICWGIAENRMTWHYTDMLKEGRLYSKPLDYEEWFVFKNLNVAKRLVPIISTIIDARKQLKHIKDYEETEEILSIAEQVIESLNKLKQMCKNHV
jgi:hypothetical protein